MHLTLNWHIGAETAGPDQRLDRAPERVHYYLKRDDAEWVLDGRSLSFEEVREKVERLGEATPEVFRDALAAVEGRRRQRNGVGPATPEALRELGLVPPTDLDRI